MKIVFIHEFGKAFIPKSFRPGLRSYLLKAGIVEVPYGAFGILFYLAYLFTFLTYFFYFWGFISSKPGFLVFIYAFLIWVVVPLSFIALFMLLMYLYLDIKIFNRTRKMEEVLPDFLQEVSTNLKGGLSFEKALWMSIKPRFGILANEIAIAAKKVMTGGDVDVALSEFANKYDSPQLKRSINLIVGEISAGGKIAGIMDKVVQNLKRTKALKDELTASVISYMIFIAIIVIFISPLLFALSFNLLVVIQKVTTLLATSTSQTGAGATSMLGKLTDVSLNKTEFVWFSHIAIGVVAFFSSIIVSIIEKGNIRGGVKYIPIFIISSQIFYMICLNILTALFGNMIQI
jgi:pilus assembly protein TadC